MTKTERPHGVVVDALTYPTPDARWIHEWRELSLDCVQITVAIWEDARETLRILARWRALLADHSHLAEVATTADQVREIASSGRTAVLFGFQNTAPIEHDIELIGTFRRLGVTVMQLTYNLQNYIGSGYWEDHDSGVSSQFGRTAIAEMNDVGVLIDLSHCGDRTTLEAIDISAAPVAITHSNPREYIRDSPFAAGRLTTLEALQAMAARGGVVGLSPLHSLNTPGQNETVEQFVDMIAWTAERIGVEAIGIGTDHCPGHPKDIPTWWRYARWSRQVAEPYSSSDDHGAFPTWMRPPHRIPVLRSALLSRGFSADEADGVLGENWLRLFAKTFSAKSALDTRMLAR